MYACPNCNGNIKFDPATQMMRCSYCDTQISPHDKMFARSADEEKGIGDDEYEITYYTCPQCGGELMTDDNTAATFCSYCGASTILEMRVGKEKKPDYIIPFKKTREDCVKEYRKVLRRAIFAPSELRKDETVDRFRGIYMPYWIYNVKSEGEFTANGSVSKRRGDYIYTTRYGIKGDLNADYNGIAYDASSSFEDRLSEAIAPFDLKDSDEFTSAYFSGFYADTDDVEAELYDQEARDVVMADVAREAFRNREYSSHGATATDVSQALEKKEAHIDHKLAMFPVWFLSNQSNDRVSYAVINGQTGRAAMDIPIDIKKYFIGVAVISVPLFLLSVFISERADVVMSPRLMLAFIFLLSVVALIFADRQGDELFIRELLFTDRGYNSRRTPEQIKETQEQIEGNVRIKKSKPKASAGKGGLGSALIYGFGVFCVLHLIPIGFFNEISIVAGVLVFIVTLIVGIVSKARISRDRVIVKAPVSRKIGTSIFPIASMIITALMWIINPVSDVYFYVTAVIGMALIGVAVSKLVSKHNTLTSRKLPQFNKRGGEEHENDR